MHVQHEKKNQIDVIINIPICWMNQYFVSCIPHLKNFHTEINEGDSKCAS